MVADYCQSIAFYRVCAAKDFGNFANGIFARIPVVNIHDDFVFVLCAAASRSRNKHVRKVTFVVGNDKSVPRAVACIFAHKLALSALDNRNDFSFVGSAFHGHDVNLIAALRAVQTFVRYEQIGFAVVADKKRETPAIAAKHAAYRVAFVFQRIISFFDGHKHAVLHEFVKGFRDFALFKR